jgi:hypothetical protein
MRVFCGTARHFDKGLAIMIRRSVRRLRVGSLLFLVWAFALAAPPAALAEDDVVVEPVWHDFGEEPNGMISSWTSTVRNVGSEPVTLGDIGFDGDAGPFTIEPSSCEAGVVLGVEESCGLTVQFTAPKLTADFEAFFVVEHDGEGEFAVGLVTASSYVAGYLVATPSVGEFGPTLMGSTSGSKQIQIHNAGDTPVTVSAVNILGVNFKITSKGCVGVIDPGERCTVAVAFAPTIKFAPRAVLKLSVPGEWGLWIQLKGVMSSPSPVVAPDSTVEADLARLADAVPRLVRGGPRRALRLPAFATVAPGELSLRLYARHRGRRVRLAMATVDVPKDSSRRLRFSLTRKGRKILRRPKVTRVSVVVAFQQSGSSERVRQSVEMRVRPRRKL